MTFVRKTWQRKQWWMAILLIVICIGIEVAGQRGRKPSNSPSKSSLGNRLARMLPYFSESDNRRGGTNQYSPPKFQAPPYNIPNANFVDNGHLNSQWFDLSTDDLYQSGPSPCIFNDSQLAYVNGELSATQTFYNCLANVADPGMIPTYYNGSYHGVLLMNSTMVLNNLERIDEVEGTARLQFSLRLRWRDDRLAMPNFWDKVTPLTQSSGIDLTNIFFTNTSFVIWTPVLRFTDASDVQFQVEYLKFNSSNIFIMGIGVDCTLLQPNYNFEKYPWDEQAVAIRFNIFSMPANLAQLGYWGGDGLVFNYNYDGQPTFKENPIWNFDSVWYTTYEGNAYNYWYYVINVSRRGEGIVLRLVLPITLLLCLGALTFWIVYENRVDTTITLLLSVSALYIVILGNIPLLGYLTDVDKFVFAMFFLLVIIVAAHQWYITLRQKQEQWPLRLAVMRLIEVFGRTAMVPAIVIYFMTHVYRQKESAPSTVAVTTTILLVFSGILWRELFGSRKVFIQCMILLLQKVNNPMTTMKDISFLELLVMNLIVFRKMSFSANYLSNHLHFHGSIDIEPYMAVSTKLQNLSLLSQLNGKSSVNVDIERDVSPPTSRTNITATNRIPLSIAAKRAHEESKSSSSYIFASNFQQNPSTSSEEFRLSVNANGLQLKDMSEVRNPLSTPISPRSNTNVDSDDEDS